MPSLIHQDVFAPYYAGRKNRPVKRPPLATAAEKAAAEQKSGRPQPEQLADVDKLANTD